MTDTDPAALTAENYWTLIETSLRQSDPQGQITPEISVMKIYKNEIRR